MERAPIVIFPYNRKERLESLIETLANCNNVEEHEVFFFSDAPNPKYPEDNEKVLEVRKYLETIKEKNFFKETYLLFSDIHKGAGKAIREGISHVFAKYDRLIDVEDDLLLAEDFLDYIDEGLEKYKSDKRIWSVCGFMTPITKQEHMNDSLFLGERSSSWGFGLWRDRWELVDWSMDYYEDFINDIEKVNDFAESGYDMPHMLVGRAEHIIDTWDIDTSYTQFINNMLSVFPKKSKSFNLGIIGANHSGDEIYQQEIDLTAKEYSFENVEYDSLIAETRKSLYMTKSQFLSRPLYSTGEKYRYYYRLMTKWMTDERKGITYEKWLEEKGVKTIAIYGAGPLGRLFRDTLAQYNGIRFEYYIDEKMDKTKVDDQIYRLGEVIPKVDMVIVTPIMEFYSLSKKIGSQMPETQIISLWEIIFG